MTAGGHVLDAILEVMPEEGGLTSREIASRLAEEGLAFTVVCPESVESYERAGEEVELVRGGSRMALSADAVDVRLSRAMSGFRRNGAGEWEPTARAEERGLAGAD